MSCVLDDIGFYRLWTNLDAGSGGFIRIRRSPILPALLPSTPEITFFRVDRGCDVERGSGSNSGSPLTPKNVRRDGTFVSEGRTQLAYTT